MSMTEQLATTSVQVEGLRDGLGRLRDVLDQTDSILGVADDVLEMADEVLGQAAVAVEKGKRVLPRVGVVLAVAAVTGVALVVIVKIRRRRAQSEQ